MPARDELGLALLQSGDVRGAIQQWQTALQINANDGNALNNLAWLFATCPDDSIRDGKQAVQLAGTAISLPGGNAPIVVRTLAAAYAESGDFEKASETAKRAIDLANVQGNASLVTTLRRELELYQAHQAYREASPE